VIDETLHASGAGRSYIYEKTKKEVGIDYILYKVGNKHKYTG